MWQTVCSGGEFFLPRLQRQWDQHITPTALLCWRLIVPETPGRWTPGAPLHALPRSCRRVPRWFLPWDVVSPVSNPRILFEQPVVIKCNGFAKIANFAFLRLCVDYENKKCSSLPRRQVVVVTRRPKSPGYYESIFLAHFDKRGLNETGWI